MADAPRPFFHRLRAKPSRRARLGSLAAALMLAAATAPGAAQGVEEALRLGREALEAGAYEDARARFEAALVEAPDNRRAKLGLGRALNKLGLNDEAIAAFDALEAARPNDPTVRFYRGVARYRAGDLDGAVADFKATLKEGVGLSVVSLRLGDAYYAQGDVENALAAYRQAVEAPNPPPAAFRALGNAFYAREDWKSAEEAYSEALRGDGRDGRAALHRAWTRERLGQEARAEEDYDRAVDILGGVDPDVSVARADLRRRQGRLQEAIEDYQRAVELDPRRPSALRGAALALLGDGRPGAAKQVLDQLVQVSPPGGAALASGLRLRGAALLSLGAYREAEADLSQALAIEPNNAAALHNRAIARAEFGDVAGALDDLRLAVTQAPEDPEARYALLRAAIAAGLRKEATKLAREAEALAERRPSESGAARAAAMLAFGRPKAALSAANAHLAERPTDLRALHVKIRALFDLKRHREALQMSLRLIALQPRRAVSHLLEAEARIALGQPEEARAALGRANALGAAPARIARLAGGAWLADAERRGGARPVALRQAADALDAAVSLSNQSPEALAMRAAARTRMGRLEQALADLDLAVASDPQNADLRFQRAELLRQLDRCDSAIRDYDAGLSLRPDARGPLGDRATCKFDQGRLLGGVTDWVASWF